MDMVQFIARNRLTGEVLELSDKEIDSRHMDVREWEITQKQRVLRNADKPMFVLRVVVEDDQEKDKFKLRLFPVFTMDDLTGMKISTSAHFITQKGMTERQLMWLEHNKEAREYGLL